MEKYEAFNAKAVENFAKAIEQARTIWPLEVRKEAYRDWALSMKKLEGLNKKTKAIVLATLLPLIITSEEVDPEVALQNAELLFLSILESMQQSAQAQ